MNSARTLNSWNQWFCGIIPRAKQMIMRKPSRFCPMAKLAQSEAKFAFGTHCHIIIIDQCYAIFVINITLDTARQWSGIKRVCSVCRPQPVYCTPSVSVWPRRWCLVVRSALTRTAAGGRVTGVGVCLSAELVPEPDGGPVQRRRPPARQDSSGRAQLRRLSPALLGRRRRHQVRGDPSVGPATLDRPAGCTAHRVGSTPLGYSLLGDD